MPSILIVDDDATVRESLLMALASLGHRSRAVSSASEAMAFLPQVDLLIADLLMSEIDGLELIQTARVAAPSLRIIAITGGGRGEPSTYLRVAQHFGAHATLQKPFSRDPLARAIKSICPA